MKAFAEDKDPGENGRVTYHFKVGNNNTQSTDEFTIDENTGELRTRVNLDREKKSNYQVSKIRGILWNVYFLNKPTMHLATNFSAVDFNRERSRNSNDLRDDSVFDHYLERYR